MLEGACEQGARERQPIAAAVLAGGSNVDGRKRSVERCVLPALSRSAESSAERVSNEVSVASADCADRNDASFGCEIPERPMTTTAVSSLSLFFFSLSLTKTSTTSLPRTLRRRRPLGPTGGLPRRGDSAGRPPIRLPWSSARGPVPAGSSAVSSQRRRGLLRRRPDAAAAVLRAAARRRGAAARVRGGGADVRWGPAERQ